MLLTRRTVKSKQHYYTRIKKNEIDTTKYKGTNKPL